MGRIRVTVDTGGTFSDFVCYREDTRQLSIFKVPSTPADPSQAIMSGLDRLFGGGVAPAEINFFLHGTTVGTNALLEGKGARTGLLVTEGFRGIYEVKEQAREYGPATFDLFFEKPRHLAPASLTGEVPERVGPRGEVLKALDPAKTAGEIERLGRAGVESLAVCLLFSFVNPAHEQAVAALIQEKLPDVSISLSSEILPQIREYYRMSTTLVNAYLVPVMLRYLQKLGLKLEEKGVKTPQCYAMQSNGGVSTFSRAGQEAVTTILSGPAGGVVAGAHIGSLIQRANLITFDMGGTSCDVSLIRDGSPLVTVRGKVAGHDLSVPMLDITTVSAGGGTMAWIDEVGVLQVGPTSAGAVPGPVCYGQGGETPTVTDANLVLGYLNPENFLGGGMNLDLDRAREVIDNRLAGPLGLSVERAAEGIISIVNVTMEEAIKSISTRRGYDLREFSLIAFGGAGPLHAGTMASNLNIPEVVIPPWPGVTSALGLLLSQVRHDYVQSRLSLIRDLSVQEVLSVWKELEETAVEGLLKEGFKPGQWRFEHFLDLRYAGQGYELSIPVEPDWLEGEGMDGLRERFDAEHRIRHGHSAATQAVELVNYRVVIYGLLEPVEVPRAPAVDHSVAEALKGERPLYFSTWKEFRSSPVYDRSRLGPGHHLEGPAVIEQYDSTVVVGPGQAVEVDAFNNLILQS